MLTWHRVQATVSSREIPTLYHKKTNMAVHDSVSSLLQHSPTFSNLLQPSSTFFDFLQPSSTFFNLLQPPRMMRCELSAWHCPSHLDCIVSHCIVLYCIVCSSDVRCIILYCLPAPAMYCLFRIVLIVLYCIALYRVSRIALLRCVQYSSCSVVTGYLGSNLKQQTQLSDSVLRL